VLKKMHRTASLSAAVVVAGALAASAAGTVPAQAAAGGTYKFRTYTGKCLAIADDSMNLGDPMIQDRCDGDALSQLFIVTKTGPAPDAYQIQTQTGKCLQVRNASTSAGAVIDIGGCQNLDSQVFTIPTADPGSWLTIRTFDGQCLQVQGTGLNDGSLVLQNPCNDTKATQKFLPLSTQ
jgi:pectate lyase